MRGRIWFWKLVHEHVSPEPHSQLLSCGRHRWMSASTSTTSMVTGAPVWSATNWSNVSVRLSGSPFTSGTTAGLASPGARLCRNGWSGVIVARMSSPMAILKRGRTLSAVAPPVLRATSESRSAPASPVSTVEAVSQFSSCPEVCSDEYERVSEYEAVASALADTPPGHSASVPTVTEVSAVVSTEWEIVLWLESLRPLASVIVMRGVKA